MTPARVLIGSMLAFGAGFAASLQESVTGPAGPQSGHIANLWWFFFWVLGIIFLLVMLAVLVTLLRKSASGAEGTESRTGTVVTGASILTGLILFVLLIASISTGKAVSELGNKTKGLRVEITGNQWWWQIRYMDSDPSRILVTANELHIPVGRPVQITGQSNDVIHSFWIPSLNGKRDLIPSRVTEEWIQADHPGIYRGQCAEFCGIQHAHMIIYVVAEPEAQFQAWYANQLKPAMAPTNPDLEQGEQAFLRYECVFCHSIRGTTASGQAAPDLTHFASRRGIAANTLPNTKGNLGGWILDPQSIKPGNHMATVAVASTDMQPLLDYLESLK